eukprot:jgi/Bigna1/72193/fgenesh1_pg.18_\
MLSLWAFFLFFSTCAAASTTKTKDAILQMKAYDGSSSPSRTMESASALLSRMREEGEKNTAQLGPRMKERRAAVTVLPYNQDPPDLPPIYPLSTLSSKGGSYDGKTVEDDPVKDDTIYVDPLSKDCKKEVDAFVKKCAAGGKGSVKACGKDGWKVLKKCKNGFTSTSEPPRWPVQDGYDQAVA